MRDLYTIGEVAKLTGSTVKTIRYYDEIKLLSPAEISPGGFRLYATDEIWKLELIFTLRYVGFSLDNIRKILGGKIRVSDAIDLQIDAIKTRVRQLMQVQAILEQALKSDLGDNSILYIHNIVEAFQMGTQARKDFIIDRIKKVLIDEHDPKEWQEEELKIFQDFLGEIPDELSEKQLLAWVEIKELLCDPALAGEVRDSSIL